MSIKADCKRSPPAIRTAEIIKTKRKFFARISDIITNVW